MTQGPDPRYWRYDRILETLESWKEAHPGILHLEQIGRTHMGEAIVAARVSGAPPEEGDAPALLFHAAQHANEANGTGAVMRMLERLLEGYGKDAEITAQVDGLRTWFVPVLNVDGHRRVFTGEVGWEEWRKNGRDNDGDGKPFGPTDGVDLNRNWDHRWEADPSDNPRLRTYKGPWPFSEPEVRALRDLVTRERPIFVVDYHSPGKKTPPNKIFWPWLWRDEKRAGPDAAAYRGIAQALAARTETEEDGVFLDGDWYGYDTLPKEQNWIYGRTGSCVLLMEISKRFWWEGPLVDRIAERVARGSVHLLERALHGPGLEGRVTDAETGRPLVAEVRVLEFHDERIGPRLTGGRHGRFRRLLDPGRVTVAITADAYEPQEHEVEIETNDWTTLDIGLRPVRTP
jgi:hypothetical protein